MEFTRKLQCKVPIRGYQERIIFTKFTKLWVCLSQSRDDTHVCENKSLDTQSHAHVEFE